MLDPGALRRAVIVGTLLQITLAVLAHYSPWIAVHASLFSGMMISATAGYLYAQDVGNGYWRGALAGALVGGFCMLVGAALSLGFGDATLKMLWIRVAISVLTGAVGGPFGQMSFNMKRMGY